MKWIESIEIFFPKASPCNKLFPQINQALTNKGLTPANTLFAECQCRDEINTSAINLLSNHWGENFHLSGLAGFPVAGVTGFTACANHVPDNGHLLFFFGPHIGVDADGQIGQVKRVGMSHATASCGSLDNYLKKIKQSPSYTPEFDIYDMGQYCVESSLDAEKEKILKNTNSIVKITETAFQKIEANLLEIIRRSGYAGSIYLFGGVLINTPLKADDYFSLRSAVHRDAGADEFKAWMD